MIVIGPTTIISLRGNPRYCSSGELNLRTRNRLSFEPAAGGLKPTFDELAYRGTLPQFTIGAPLDFATRVAGQDSQTLQRRLLSSHFR
jgi:hypothetical protein